MGEDGFPKTRASSRHLGNQRRRKLALATCVRTPFQDNRPLHPVCAMVPTGFEPDSETVGQAVHESVVRRDEIQVQDRGVTPTSLPKHLNIRLRHRPRLASQFDGVIQQSAIHWVDLRTGVVAN